MRSYKKYYPHIDRYNLDNEPDEVLINKVVDSEENIAKSRGRYAT